MAQPAAAAPNSNSLTAQWQSYSKADQDVEGGLISSAQPIGDRVQDATSAFAGLFTAGYTQLSTTLTSVGAKGLSAVPTVGIPSSQQVGLAVMLFGAGAFFLGIAFMVFLPILIVAPAKFAISFTVGCALLMGGVTVLRGWQQQLTHMMSTERLPFSAAYVGSVLATLYSSLIVKSYLLSLVSSGLQMVALVYYLMSYIPGGASGVQFAGNMVVSGIRSFFSK